MRTFYAPVGVARQFQATKIVAKRSSRSTVKNAKARACLFVARRPSPATRARAPLASLRASPVGVRVACSGGQGGGEGDDGSDGGDGGGHFMTFAYLDARSCTTSARQCGERWRARLRPYYRTFARSLAPAHSLGERAGED